MRTLLLLAGFAVAAAGLPQAALAQSSDAGEGLTGYVQGFNQVFARGEIDRWIGFWAEGAERILPSNRQKGLREIRLAYQALYAAYLEMRLIEQSRTVRGGEAVVECLFEGVYRRNGNSVSQPVTLTLRFDDAGKITFLRADFDEEAFLNQIRAQRA